jgi:hypothetical protein
VTSSRRFPRITLNSVRLLLPWIAIWFVSVTLASAVNSVVGGGVATTAHEQSTMSGVVTSFVSADSGQFGVISNTSPASTGHASSNGCCTWD